MASNLKPIHAKTGLQPIIARPAVIQPLSGRSTQTAVGAVQAVISRKGLQPVAAYKRTSTSSH